jgi:hypothetical protein
MNSAQGPTAQGFSQIHQKKMGYTLAKTRDQNIG